MKTSIQTLCTLLAAANFSRGQVKEILDDLYNSNSKKIIQEFDLAQQRLKNRIYETETSLTEKPDDSTINKIEEIILDIGIRKFAAYHILSSYLEESFPGQTVPRFNAKQGFTYWLKDVLKTFSPSEVLHVATRMKNKFSHELPEPDDWIHR